MYLGIHTNKYFVSIGQYATSKLTFPESLPSPQPLLVFGKGVSWKPFRVKSGVRVSTRSDSSHASLTSEAEQAHVKLIRRIAKGTASRNEMLQFYTCFNQDRSFQTYIFDKSKESALGLTHSEKARLSGTIRAGTAAAGQKGRIPAGSGGEAGGSGHDREILPTISVCQVRGVAGGALSRRHLPEIVPDEESGTAEA